MGGGIGPCFAQARHVWVGGGRGPGPAQAQLRRGGGGGRPGPAQARPSWGERVVPVWPRPGPGKQAGEKSPIPKMAATSAEMPATGANLTVSLLQ